MTGSALLASGNLGHVLVIGAETLSRVVDPKDRGTCILFGDGAAGVVLAPSPDDGPGLLAWDLGCDGSASGLLGIPAGGSRRPATPATIAAGEQFIKMQGQEVFRRAVRAVVDSVKAALAQVGMTGDDIDWFVPHQANARIIEAAASRLGISPERTIVNIDRFGNTSAASIPLAIERLLETGQARSGDLALLIGFGAGLVYAAQVVRIP